MLRVAKDTTIVCNFIIYRMSSSAVTNYLVHISIGAGGTVHISVGAGGTVHISVGAGGTVHYLQWLIALSLLISGLLHLH